MAKQPCLWRVKVACLKWRDDSTTGRRQKDEDGKPSSGEHTRLNAASPALVDKLWPAHSPCQEIMMQRHEWFSRQMQGWDYIADVSAGQSDFRSTSLVQPIKTFCWLRSTVGSFSFFTHQHPEPFLLQSQTKWVTTALSLRRHCVAPLSGSLQKV